jgi:hypothetical protein
MVAAENIRNRFTNLLYIRKAEIRGFLNSMLPGLTEQSFRKELYALEQEKTLIPIGAGLYVLGSTFNREVYLPVLSNQATTLANMVVQKFPFTTYLVWETRQLWEFMVHQPAQNLVILEVEKDASEPVFNQIRDETDQKLMLNPGQLTYERYFMNNGDIASVIPMITKSPKQKVRGLVTARLEKMLVDVFVGKNQFIVFQGSELVNIFVNAFAKYWINPKILFRYAIRRKMDERLKNFLLQKAHIEPELIEQG